MAERRMIAKSVIETDLFMDMPMSSQCLYFHLLLRADDDGFIKNPSAIRREVGCSGDDMKLLVAKKFILPFDTGVIVIRHWKIHNYIRKDMYHPTECQAEKSMLSLENDKTAYKLEDGASVTQENIVVTNSLQTCNEPVTDALRACTEPVSIGKDRLGKDNISSSSSARARERGTDQSDNDAELGKVVSAYANNINPTFGAREREELIALYEAYKSKWMLAAIDEAALSSRTPNMHYIQAILERWQRDGFKAPRKERKKGASHAGGTRGNLSEAQLAENERFRRDAEEWESAPQPWEVSRAE